MGRRPERLLKRGNVFWIRVRVPDALRDIIGKTEIRRSLRTSDPAEARSRLRFESAKIEGELDLARRARARSEPRPELTDPELLHLVTDWFVRAEKASAAGLPPLTTSERIEEAEEALADALHPTDVDDPAMAATVAILQSAGWSDASTAGEGTLSPAVDHEGDLRRLDPLVRQALVEHERRNLMRLTGRSEPLDPRWSNFSADTVLKPVAKLTFGQLIDRHAKDAARPAVSPKTKLKYEAQVRLLKSLIGASTPVASIDRADARRVLDTLKAMPANMGKRFRKMSIKDVLALSPDRRGKPMSAVTANTYMTAFFGLMEFAVKEGFIEKNPVAGLRVPPDPRPARSRRAPFTPTELTHIFSAPLYTGCIDDGYNYARTGNTRPRRGRFWVPLLSLFTGMRLNEACQLTADDIVKEGDVDVILIRSDEAGAKRVKTAAGHRFVPLHPELALLGFAAFVQERRASDGPTARLFPELAMASTGYYSDNFSKWFAHFLNSVGITDKSKTFHSFRHTFRDALREADLSLEKVQALGGWTSGSTDAVYGSGLSAKTLAADIAKVKYGGLDLRHLRPVG